MLEFRTEYIAAGGNRHPSAADWNPLTGLLAFGSDRNVALWEPLGSHRSTGLQLLLIGHSDLVTAVKFFPRASHLDQVIVSGAVDKSIRLWKLSKASVELVAVPEAHASTVTCLAVCPGTDVLVTGSASAIFKVWRVEWAEESAQVLNLQTVHLEPRLFPLTLALHRLPGSDDDLILAVAGTKNTVQVYVAGKHGDFVHQATLVGHEGWVNFVAISKQANRNSDGLLLASASQDKYIRLWRITRHEVKQEDELSIEAYEESLSNRRHELRGCKSNYLLTFEALLLGHEDWIHTVSWCLDNDHLRLLSASADNSIAIWEPERNSGIWLPTTRLGEISAQKGSTTATGSTGGFWIGLWSGNGESIVSLGRTGSWRIWNWNPSQDRWVQGVGISGHTKTIPDIAWAKGGAYIISVSTDQTARLHAPWNTGLRPSWHEMARPQIHGYDLSCIDSLAQSYFVSGADEKLLRVFEESRGTAQLLGRLCGIKEPVGKTLPLTARIPALGLSNKAIDAEDLETVADEGFGTQSLAPRASSNDGDGTAQSPPTEDDLARRTLWPEQEKLYGHGYEISAVAASYGGSIVATACKASSLEHAVIRIYSTDDWREVKPSLKAHSLTVTGLAFSKDDRYLLSVGRDRQWALFARSIDGTLSYSVAHADSKGHTRMILDACWAPLEAGYTFATAGRDKVVKIWCLRSQGAENVATLATPSSATSVDIAPRLVDDELLLAVGTESSEVEIYAIGMIRWDARMRSEGKDMSWASRAITRVRWRPQLGSGSLELAIAMKLLTTFLLSYPLAAVLKRLSDSQTWQKNAFITGVSIFYLVGLFDLWSGIRTILISSAGAYLIAGYIDGPFMPWIGFVFLMGHMSISHISRQFVDDSSVVDITGVQMVLVMKLTAYCWNVHDGRLPQQKLSDFQKQRAILQLPSLLDFTGYVLFFPSLFAGPSFDYNEYRQWIEATMFEPPPGADPATYPKTRKQRKIPRSGTPATMKAAVGFIWLFLFLQFSAWYNTQLVLGDQYMRYGFLRRIWILEMLGFVTRMKYYGVWSLTEGACILSGMGFNGVSPKTGKVEWNRLQNVNPWGIESAQNSRAYLENWNMNTNHWLRNYMYLRVTPRGKKPGFRASLATFVTSAVWHGFYPGYYLSFVLAAFLQTIAKNFRRHVRPFFMTADGQQPTRYKVYYDGLSYLATQTAFCFTTAPFVLLTLGSSTLVWSRVYFYAVVGATASVAFFSSPGKAWLAGKLEERNKTFVQTKQGKERAHKYPLLGLPEDPAGDVGDAVNEIKQEVEARRRSGSRVSMPAGEEMRKAVEERIGKKGA